MADGSALPQLDFTHAKTGLSAVMDDVVHNHQPRVVQRRGREAMLLVRPDDLARWLEPFRLEVGLVLDGGEVTAEIREMGVLGFGETVEEALADLASELRAYAQRVFERSQFYVETDRARHYPALLRFALTPQEEQLDLIRGDIEAGAESPQRETSGATA